MTHAASRHINSARRLSRALGALFVVTAGIAVVVPASADAGPAPAHRVGLRAEHGPATHYDHSAPLRSLPAARSVTRHQHADSPMPTPTGPTVADPVVQSASLATSAPATSSSFAGIGVNGSAPSDSNGAVGPNNYVDLVNAQIQVFNKSGVSEYGPVPTNTLWSGFGGGCQNQNDGDGIVRYDALADRWVVSQFALGPSGQGPFLQCVAVSATADPTGSYYRYSFAFNNFPDYPKLAVWPDGYYQTMNMFNSAGAFLGADTCAYDRASMLEGLSAAMQCFNTGTAYGALLPGNLSTTTAPPAGAPNMQIGLGRDNTHLASFAFHVDWSPGYTGTSLTESDVAVATYSGACNSGGACIPQPHTSQTLDSLADRMMYSYEYMNFGDHESWVVNYSVDVNGSAEPRWYELRRTPASATGPLSVYQESTFAPDATNRWMGSTAMDRSGDIGLGYSESSSKIYPSIAYTGRTPSDPLNTMEPETIMWSGAGSQTGGLNRWGDYSSMNVDPTNGCTFWYTNQYLPSTGSFNWATRIGTFSFPTCQPRTDSDFSTALVPTTGSVANPGTLTTTVSAGWTAGSSQSLAFSASGLPTGVTASFSPASVTVGPGQDASSTLTFNVAADTVAGTYPVTVVATGTSGSHRQVFTLTVGTAAPPADFSLTATPSSQSVVAGTTTSYSATVSSLNNFAGVVNFALSGLPAGASASFSPASVTGSGSTTLSVTTTSATPASTSSLTITATSGSLSHTASTSLTVTDAPSFSLSATPSSATVGVGASTAFSATVTGSGGFSGIVALAVSGLPTGASSSFSLGAIAGSGSSVVTVATSSSTPAGTYPLVISGSSGSVVQSVTVTLIVTGPANFNVSISPSSQSTKRGTVAHYSVTVTPLNGFSGPVSLSFAPPSRSGLSGSFSPSSLTSGTSTLSVAAGSKTGGFTFRVTGAGGGISRSVSATLDVTH